MFTVEHSIFVERPVQEVFDFVSNPENAHRWQSSMISAEWLSEGPVGEGSRERTVVRFMGRDIESTVEYTAWDPPHGYSFQVVSGPVPLESSTRFEARDNGTLYSTVATVEAGGFFKLAEGLVKRQVNKTHETDLAKLKSVLENGD